MLGFGTMVVAALVASSANTKTAEAHSNQGTFRFEAETPAAIVTTPSAAPALTTVTATSAATEAISPPPANPYLENPKLRRMQKDEISLVLMQEAARIVRKHHAKPVGTQVEVAVDGKRVVARIERHFHPEGGPVKPWGFHPGVSLFVYR
jgi:hypothetical protein